MITFRKYSQTTLLVDRDGLLERKFIGFKCTEGDFSKVVKKCIHGYVVARMREAERLLYDRRNMSEWEQCMLEHMINRYEDGGYNPYWGSVTEIVNFMVQHTLHIDTEENELRLKKLWQSIRDVRDRYEFAFFSGGSYIENPLKDSRQMSIFELM